MPTIDSNVSYTEKKHTKPPTMPNNTKIDAPLLLGSNCNDTTDGIHNIQGQKWQQVFDFEKVLKQLRSAEKAHIRGKSAASANDRHTSQGTNSGTAPSSSNNTVRQVVQVQRLQSQDMQYYDVAPKEKTRDIVICNACTGLYTKMGFNNHMMMQHPSIWNTVSSKPQVTLSNEMLNSMHSGNTAADNSQDGIREIANAEILGSPAEMMSTCSNSSTSSSFLSYNAATAAAVAAVSIAANAAASTSSRHKSSKSSSSKTAGSSNSGSNANRSRSKNKHHHGTTSAASSLLSTEVTTTHKSSSSNSKKHTTTSSASTSHATAISTPIPTKAVTEITTAAASAIIPLYASSSNSSCSLPTITKMPINPHETAHGSMVAGSMLENNFTPATAILPISELKDKHALEISLIAPKKKSKSPLTAVLQETIDGGVLAAPSSDYERLPVQHHKSKSHHGKASAKKPTISKHLPAYESQMSELDQAVSSITGEHGSAATVVGVTAYTQQSTELANIGDETMQHNTSDDNSISLTLDEMLDSKFINEILNNAESEIPFDENALDPALQQPVNSTMTTANYMQPPSSKRMRFNDNTNSDSGDIVAAYPTIYQQQQQQQYEAVDMEDEQQDHEQQQAQLTTIDAMQLQQLLYQQQILDSEQKPMDIDGNSYTTLTYENAALNTTAAANQQFSVYDVPSLTDDNLEETTGEQQEQDQLENMMMPSIIYEITHNSDTVMDQQSQQQVIAEFLTQAGYNNVEQMNVITASAGPDGVINATAASNNNNNNPTWSDFNELCDLDFTKLETVKNLSATSAPTTTTATETSEIKTVKLETNHLPNDHLYQPHQKLAHTKHNEDYYLNVYLYAGMPRPSAINSFNMMKLPQSVATTFRKHLLTTRKANNSLLNINGGVARFPHNAGAVKQNFYVGSNSSPVSNSTNNNVNEYSIGNITITNANSNNPSIVQTSKHKATPATSSIFSSTNGLVNTGANGVPMPNGRTTIHVNKSCTIPNDRFKCIKRSLISKLDNTKKAIFTPKSLSDILNGKTQKEKSSTDQQSSDTNVDDQPANDVATEKHGNSIQSFYERRRKLLNSMNRNQNGLHLSNKSYAAMATSVIPKQRQEKLQKKQVIRTLNDCGTHQWKSNTNAQSAGTATANADMMRLYA